MNIIEFRKLLLLQLLLIIYLSAFSQNNSIIKGVVTDSITGEPLIAATISLRGTSIGTISNNSGSYYLSNIPKGKNVLVVHYLGYEEKNINIEFNKVEVLTLNFSLQYSGGILLEDVVISTQAKGQVAAINQQIASNSIINVVSSSRIQEIPDANAAESVGRLPGVTIVREGGEGSKVVIRGLPPKFSNITVNGVKMAATDGEDRSVNLSMISPYMLEGIEVSKTALVSQEADAMAGSVNFVIKKAPEGFKTDLMVQGGYSNLNKTFGNFKIMAAASNRFFKNKLGAFVQTDIENRDRDSQDVGVSYVSPDRNTDTTNRIFNNSINQYNKLRQKNIYSGTFVLDYNVKNGNIRLTNFGSHSNTEGTFYGDLSNINTRTRDYTGEVGDKSLGIYTSVLNYNQNFGSVNIIADLAYTLSDNNSPNKLRWIFTEDQAFTDTVTKNKTLDPSEIYNYANNNEFATTLRGISSQNEHSREMATSMKVDLTYDFLLSDKISGAIKIGGKYRYQYRFRDISLITEADEGFKYTHNGGVYEDAWKYVLGSDWAGENQSNSFGFEYFIGQSPTESFLGGEFPFGANADLSKMLDMSDLTVLNGNGTENQFEKVHNDYKGYENYYAGYASLDLNIGTMIQIVSGARYEKNMTNYSGIQGDSEIQVNPYYDYKHDTASYERNNDFFLPQFHLRFKPLNWFYIRFAYTNSLNRPDYLTLIPRYSIMRNFIKDYVNYTVKPAHSKNFDLNFTFHENHIGLFSIGYYSKQISNFMMSTGGRVITDISAYYLPQDNRLIGYQVWETINLKDDSYVYGLEAEWQSNFYFLPGILRGLAFNINYSHIWSEAKYPYTIVSTKEIEDENGFPIDVKYNIDTTYTSRLVGQPNNMLNSSLGFDYKGFSFRLSFLFKSDVFERSDFVKELRSSRDQFYRLDLSVKQNLPIEGMQVFLNINNITGTPDRSFLNGSNSPTYIQYYGMTLDIGLRYRF
jgi:TonB-dependent receptor